jgi:hypothetical protein
MDVIKGRTGPGTWRGARVKKTLLLNGRNDEAYAHGEKSIIMTR